MVYDGFWDEYEERKDEYVPRPAQTPPKDPRGPAYDTAVVTAVRDAGLAPSRRTARKYIKENGGYAVVGAALNVPRLTKVTS